MCFIIYSAGLLSVYYTDALSFPEKNKILSLLPIAKVVLAILDNQRKHLLSCRNPKAFSQGVSIRPSERQRALPSSIRTLADADCGDNQKPTSLLLLMLSLVPNPWQLLFLCFFFLGDLFSCRCLLPG